MPDSDITLIIKVVHSPPDDQNMRILTEKNGRPTEKLTVSKFGKVKLKMAGCFEFRHRTASFDCHTLLTGGGLSKLGKMLRSRSENDVNPDGKVSDQAKKSSPKSSPSGSPANPPRRRFVRVVRTSDKGEHSDYHNPHVIHKTSPEPQVKKVDLEALNKRYFSDSDSDSDGQQIKDFRRCHSEERSMSPSIGHGPLRKNLSLDSEQGSKHAHFREEVDVIGFDKKGKRVYFTMEKIQFDTFEECPLNGYGSSDSDSDFICRSESSEVLDPISETPELAKSPPRLYEGMQLAQKELSKSSDSDASQKDSEGQSQSAEKPKEEPEVTEEKVKGQETTELKDTSVPSVNPDRHRRFSAPSGPSEDQLEQSDEPEEEPRARTSSFDLHLHKTIGRLGRLFRSTSDSIAKFGSPKGSPAGSPDQQRRHQRRYLRILRASDHGDEYYNPYVIRRGSKGGSVDDMSAEPLRPILRKHHSLDLPMIKHAHFRDSVEIIEFHKKTKCVNLMGNDQQILTDQLKVLDDCDAQDMDCLKIEDTKTHSAMELEPNEQPSSVQTSHTSDSETQSTTDTVSNVNTETVSESSDSH